MAEQILRMIGQDANPGRRIQIRLKAPTDPIDEALQASAQGRPGETAALLRRALQQDAVFMSPALEIGEIMRRAWQKRAQFWQGRTQEHENMLSHVPPADPLFPLGELSGRSQARRSAAHAVRRTGEYERELLRDQRYRIIHNLTERKPKVTTNLDQSSVPSTMTVLDLRQQMLFVIVRQDGKDVLLGIPLNSDASLSQYTYRLLDADGKQQLSSTSLRIDMTSILQASHEDRDLLQELSRRISNSDSGILSSEIDRAEIVYENDARIPQVWTVGESDGRGNDDHIVAILTARDGLTKQMDRRILPSRISELIDTLIANFAPRDYDLSALKGQADPVRLTNTK